MELITNENINYDNSSNNSSNNTNNFEIYNKNSDLYSYCSNCGNDGHLFKNCSEPVNSYGLLCFYKKKSMVKDTIQEFINKRAKTKKNDFSLKKNNSTSNCEPNSESNINSKPNKKLKYHKYYQNSNNNNNSNINKIKILKRHESITHTLKNMIGIVGENPCETTNIVSDVIDDTNNIYEEIDNMDNMNNINNMNNTNNTNNTNNMNNINDCEIIEIIDMDDEFNNNPSINESLVDSVSEPLLSHTLFPILSNQTKSQVQLQQQLLTHSLTQSPQQTPQFVKMKEITIHKVLLVQRIGY